MRRTVLAVALLSLTPVLHAQDAAPAAAKPFTAAETTRYMEIGQAATRYFFEGHADSLLAMGDSAFQARVGGVDGIRQQVDRLAERAGMVLNVLDQKMTRRNGTPQCIDAAAPHAARADHPSHRTHGPRWGEPGQGLHRT